MTSILTIEDFLKAPEEQKKQIQDEAAQISVSFEEHLAKDKGDSHIRAPGIHASEVHGCERKMVYSLLGTERKEKLDNTWKKRFMVGHALHAMLQTQFEQMAGGPFVSTFQSEVKISPELQPVAAAWNIQSHCDGLFQLRRPGEPDPFARVVLEIKTASPGEYDKLKAPKPEHVEQAHVYMGCLDTPFTWFLYWNKGNQNYTGSNNPSFFTVFNPDTWMGLLKKFERGHIAADTNQLPDRLEGVGCDFCAFSWTCKPQYLQRRSGTHVPHGRWVSK